MEWFSQIFYGLTDLTICINDSNGHTERGKIVKTDLTINGQDLLNGSRPRVFRVSVKLDRRMIVVLIM